jgi:hypothetical protein
MPNHLDNVNAAYKKAYQGIGFFAIAPGSLCINDCGLLNMQDTYSGGDEPTGAACVYGGCTILFGGMIMLAGEAVTLPLALAASIVVGMTYPLAAAGSAIRDCASREPAYETIETPSEEKNEERNTPRPG